MQAGKAGWWRMQYIFVNDDGVETKIKVDAVKGGVTYFVEAGDEVVIFAQEVYDDLVNEISMSGKGFGLCHEIITDRYMREHSNVSWEGLTTPLRERLVKYLEELRLESVDDVEDPFYNDGKPWAVTDIYF